MKSNIIIICGWPLSGKTTIAKELQIKTGYHAIDIDEIAHICIGSPQPNWEDTVEGQKKNVNRMRMAYELLHQVLRVHLDFSELNNSLIISATYSSQISWKYLLKTVEPYNSIRLKVIWLSPSEDKKETIAELLSQRKSQYSGGCTSINEYFSVKERFTKPPIPFVQIDTWPINNVQFVTKTAMNYIFNNLTLNNEQIFKK